MLRDNLAGLIEPMLNGARAYPLALRTNRKQSSDDRPPCLENPLPAGAESTLTENVASPFHAEPGQYSDPCRSNSFSRGRLVLMATLFLCLTLASLLLFFLLMNKPYGLQEAPMSSTRYSRCSLRSLPLEGSAPSLFTCPAVEPQPPAPALSHLGFPVGRCLS